MQVLQHWNWMQNIMIMSREYKNFHFLHYALCENTLIVYFYFLYLLASVLVIIFNSKWTHRENQSIKNYYLCVRYLAFEHNNNYVCQLFDLSTTGARNLLYTLLSVRSFNVWVFSSLLHWHLPMVPQIKKLVCLIDI